MINRARLKQTYARRGAWKLFLYALQAIFAIANLALLRLLPFWIASAWGGLLFRLIGPLLKQDRTARRNLAQAFPDWEQSRIDATMRDVWDNLGRNAGEFSQLDRLDLFAANGRISISGLDYLTEAQKAGGFVAVTAHYGSWELTNMICARSGSPLNAIYRSIENPWLDAYLRRHRSHFANRLLPKGTGGLRTAFKCLKQGEPLGLLFDQKLNEGKLVPFLGRPAPTATAPIEAALRLKVPILVMRVQRIEKTRFDVTVYPLLTHPDSGDSAEDAIRILGTLNRMLEEWIHESPGQWFWVHNRWP